MSISSDPAQPSPDSSFEEALSRSQTLETALKTDPTVHRVLTGDRPTGSLHIGHDFGSIKNRVRLQNLGVETFIVIADYQVLTDRDDTTSIASNVNALVLDYLALGLDPWNRRTFIFPHSHIPELHQLVLPFSMLITLPELERNPTTKDEMLARRIQNPSIGMLMYPISQAADILFCKSTVVPVGKDQLPHIELTRRIARRFNTTYSHKGHVFPLPSALLSDTPLILGLDGGQKMSKSRSNAIFFTMSSDTVREVIRSAKTDSYSGITYEPQHRPQISNLVLLYSLCGGVPISNVVETCERYRYDQFKVALVDVVNAYLEPIRRKRAEFAAERGLVQEVLRRGIAVARQSAAETLEEVRSVMNMDYQSGPPDLEPKSQVQGERSR